MTENEIGKIVVDTVMEPTADEALLTAYLDGELTPQDRQHLEQRLANEPVLRQRLSLLEETWHYLDFLEQESTDVEQIETTMRVAAVSVSATSFPLLKTNRWSRWGIAALVGLALFIIPFQLGKRSLLDDPSFRRMVERLDMYLAVADNDDVELLQKLAVKRVFLPPMDTIDNKPDSRVDNTDLNQLCYRNAQRFLKLSWEKQKQIRKLHRDIEIAPQPVELEVTLQNYAYWRKSLQAYEKSELQKSASLDEKAANIIALKNRLDKLLPNDAPPFLAEMVGIEESQRLVESLVRLPAWRKEQLLNNAPFQIITELRQLSDDSRRRNF